jgi:hypothetical protein
MAAGIPIREFFAILGLEVDKRDFEQGERSMQSLKDGLKVVVGLATVAAGAIGVLTNQYVKQANQLDDWSDLTGESVERLHAFQIAAERLGDDAGAAINGMVNLAARIRDTLKSGSPEKTPAAQALRDLGISINDVKDLPITETFDLILDGLRRVPDAADRTAVAMDLFGRHGGQAINSLDSDKLREFRDEAIALGLVMTAEDVKSAKEFQAAFKGLIAVVQAMIATGLGPLLVHMTRFGRFLQQWILLNREIIKQRFERIVELVAKAIGFALPKVRDYVSAFGDLLRALGGAENIIKAVGYLIGIYLTAQLGNVVELGFLKAIKALQGFNLAMLRSNLLALLLGGLMLVVVLAVDELITRLKGGETAIDDFFNPKKVKPDDNVLVKSLRAVLLQIGLVQKALTSIFVIATEGLTSEVGRGALKDLKTSVNFALGFKGIRDQEQAARFLEGLPFQQPLSVEHIEESPLLPPATVAPSIPRAGGNTTSISINGGPINVTAPPGADPAAVGDAVGRAVEERNRQLIDEASRKLEGGG